MAGLLRAKNPLILNLSRHDSVSDEEERVLNGTVDRIESFRAGEDVVLEDSRPSESCLMLTGFTARCHILDDGKRQLTALHVPGDFLDLHSLLLKVMDHGVVALTDCQIARVPHDRLRKISQEQPHLTRLLWLSTVIDAAIHRAWIVAMGRRSADGQLAHLLCEVYLRLEAVDLTEGYKFDFDVTQSEVADMLGRSVVHVNRTLQFLRKKGVLTWAGKTVTIEDWERLQAIADFDPTYLSLRKEPR
ncbi:MAG: Crp/Fnr family transcriptional regulator [Rhizobiaceae bacterium]|jgi:CRP-like cAMP-binding protein